MNNSIIRKTKWFWPWQDAQEEAWLEEMSKQGLHLKHADLFAQYQFTQGQPQLYTYRLDFQDAMKTKTKEEYLRLFTDAGWEYLGQMGGWQYFRKPTQPGDQDEIFTDAETKIQKYNRFQNWFGLAFPSYLIVFVALWGSWPEWMMWLNVSIIFFIAFVWGFISIKVSKRIKQLKAL
jgi:hypothetical protein